MSNSFVDDEAELDKRTDAQIEMDVNTDSQNQEDDTDKVTKSRRKKKAVAKVSEEEMEEIRAQKS